MWVIAPAKEQDKIKVRCEEGEGWFFTRGQVYEGRWVRKRYDDGREKVLPVFGVTDNYGECYIYPNDQFTIIEGSKTPPKE